MSDVFIQLSQALVPDVHSPLLPWQLPAAVVVAIGSPVIVVDAANDVIVVRAEVTPMAPLLKS